MRDWGPWTLRCVVGFATTLATFVALKNRDAIDKLSARVAETPLSWGFLASHGAAIGVFLKISSLIYAPGISGRADLLALSWFVAGFSAISFAGLAVLRWRFYVELFDGTGFLWAWALVAAVSACVIGDLGRSLWRPTIHLTFGLAKLFLGFFVPRVVANPEIMALGTPRFLVQVTPQCSGLEGIGLTLAFVTLWLLVFRRECRFPQSLVLIPCGVVLIFVLNAARLAVLILLGNAGAQQVALGGFHSQAGWIAFSAVTVLFCCAIQQVPWFSKRQDRQERASARTENPTAAFLLPFLVALAVGMIAGMFSGGFEWLYPLRFIASAAMLWVFRRSYANLNWRFNWVAVAIGAVAFLIWIGLSHVSMRTEGGIPLAFATSSEFAKATWISFRVAAAIVTVPLAEELAFRAFLMRRLISEDFEAVSLQCCSWFALLLSAMASGVLQEGHWLAGSVAGILFGVAAVRRGRIGDAVAAHATANALLALYVLAYHQWHLW